MAKATANVTIGGSQTDFFVDLTALELEIEADYIMQQAEIEAKNYAQTFGVPIQQGWDVVIADLENFDDPNYNKNGGLFRGAKTRIQRTIREQTKHMVAKPVEELAKDKDQLFFWELGIVKSDHCGDCYRHSRMGAKTKAGWLDLGKGLPRWGLTECNIGCRCMLRPTSKGSGTTKTSKKALKQGVVTGNRNKGLGQAVSGVVKNTPLSRNVKDKVMDRTKKIKDDLKQKQKEAELKQSKLTQDEKNDLAFKRGVNDLKRDLKKADDKYNARNKDNPDAKPQIWSQRIDDLQQFIKYHKTDPELAKTFFAKHFNMADRGGDTISQMLESVVYQLNHSLTGGTDQGSQNFLMKGMLKEAGMWEKPRSVKNKDFDQIRKTEGNGDVYYRGMAVNKDLSESYWKAKDTWAGKGYYGDGVYCANPRAGVKGDNKLPTHVATANAYVRGGATDLSNQNAWIIKFTMQKGSKSAKWSDLDFELKTERHFMAKEVGHTPETVRDFFVYGEYLHPKWKNKYNHLQDVGSLAVRNKIDIIHVDKSLDGNYGQEIGYSVVINRSKMICVDKAGKATQVQPDEAEKMEWIYGGE